MSAAGQPRIFVQIASYRDLDCQYTVQDLFARAAHPGRIFVGICWQFDAVEDRDCFQLVTRPDQVRVVEYDARAARGVGFARREAQKLLGDEDYVLQIDAHHRFVDNWDERMLGWLARCPSDKPILTTFPQGFVPPRSIPEAGPLGITVKDFADNAFPIMGSRILTPQERGGDPLPTAFVASNFIFSPAAAVREVPIDPHHYFDGDDISMATRYWTSGWDMFSPVEHLIWHDWNRQGRRSHWDDDKDWYKLKLGSNRRLRHLLGIEPTSDGQALHEIEAYGLGKARSLAQYQAYAGIDFAARRLSPAAREGRPCPLLPPASPSVTVPSKNVLNLKQLKKMNEQAPQKHQPRKVLVTEQFEVYDDFLPEDVLAELYRSVIYADHKHINTGEKISRSWRPHDGFPMRSDLSVFWYHQPAGEAEKKPRWVYPSGTGFDLFADGVSGFAPQVAHMVGEQGRDWQAFSISSFIYPAHTGLSLHKDGRQIYSGAYTFFLSPYWDIHWGGLLIVLDPATQLGNEEIKVHGQNTASFANVWLDRERENPHVYTPGLGQVVLPKRNRMVFINPDCLHMVTHVNEHAGDHVRMALSGFFHAKPPKW
ncbi:MAG: 2OG-Fe(II) oxygenase [Proteobacteria bacterium]|nr:2OG-Fe(II) oxygenase [Pseudomonadota bacterium]